MTVEEAKKALELGLLVDYCCYHGNFTGRRVSELVYKTWGNGKTEWRLFLTDTKTGKDTVTAPLEECTFSKVVAS